MVLKIKSSTLFSLLDASKNSAPLEFASLLSSSSFFKQKSSFFDFFNYFSSPNSSDVDSSDINSSNNKFAVSSNSNLSSLDLSNFSEKVYSDDIIIDGFAVVDSVSSSSSVFINLNSIPFDLSVVGSFHSHPSIDSSFFPSAQDLAFFKRYYFNFIAAFPFSMGSIRCFSSSGKLIDFDII